MDKGSDLCAYAQINASVYPVCLIRATIWLGFRGIILNNGGLLCVQTYKHNDMKTMRIMTLVAAIATFYLSGNPDVYACTRVVYAGRNGTVITGRNLDWKAPIPTNLYVQPRGISRVSSLASGAIEWRSRYGSVVAVGYDMGVSEGMNECGLVCNLLYLPGTEYKRQSEYRVPMTSSLWAQYILDNYKDVDEVVAGLSLDKIYIEAPDMPGGAATTLHAAVSDSSGDCAIIEYVDGQICIKHGRECRVLTNAPVYERQLAINDYWRHVGGKNMLPGTNSSSDRFVRASFYAGCIPDTARHEVALAGVFGVLFNCAVPVGVVLPDSPEVSQTQWRSVADHANLVYYFAMTYNPSVIWADLRQFDLGTGAPIMKLDLTNRHKAFVGNVLSEMRPDKGFVPMYTLDQWKRAVESRTD